MIKKRKKLAQWVDTGNGQLNMHGANQRGLRIVFDVICVLIFVCAARIMLHSVFGFGGISVSGIISAVIIALIVSGTMEWVNYTASFDDRKRNKYKIILLISGVVITLFYLLVLKIGDKTIAGMQEFMEDYLAKWNVYYKSNISIQKVDSGDVELAVSFVLAILVFVSLWLSKQLGKKLILLVIPLVVVAMEVTVGYAPGKLGVIVMFVSVVLANILECEETDFKTVSLRTNETGIGKTWVYAIGVSIVLTVTSIGASKLVASPSKEMIKYSDAVKEIQDRMLEDFSISQLISDIIGMFSNNKKEEEIISNAPLAFKNQPVLELHLSDRPKDTIYLKDFYGSKYVDGTWVTDDKEFEKAAKAAGYKVNEIKKNISYMGVASILNREVSDVPVEKIEGTLKYLKNKQTNVYVPYFSKVSDDDLSIEGDVFYTKSKKDKNISYGIWYPGQDYGLSMIQYIQGGQDDWEIWYEKYVDEKYLQVPKDMTNIKTYAEQIQSDNDLLSLKMQYNENETRVKIAEAVADWFAENVEYTLRPPSLPNNMDPIEYFVGESKEGYCMHYASAATLMLRELGVPARYASGYYVSKSIFERVDDGYKGVIIDNTAHAWVEIYLDIIGWVPFEVTTSYREPGERNPNIEENKETESTDNKPDNDQKETESNDKPDETKDNDQASQQSSTEKNSEKNEATTNALSDVDEDKTGKGPGYYGTGNDALKKSTVGKVILFSVIALLVGVVIYFVIVYKRRQEAMLEILIKKKRCVRAITTINRRLYASLKKKGKLIGSKHSDDEYKEALVKTYDQISREEWDKYMDIVREMAFSNNDGDEASMEYCYDIYKRVRK